MLYSEFISIYNNIKNNSLLSCFEKQILFKKMNVVIYCRSEQEFCECHNFKTICPSILYYRSR